MPKTFIFYCEMLDPFPEYKFIFYDNISNPKTPKRLWLIHIHPIEEMILFKITPIPQKIYLELFKFLYHLHWNGKHRHIVYKKIEKNCLNESYHSSKDVWLFSMKQVFFINFSIIGSEYLSKFGYPQVEDQGIIGAIPPLYIPKCWLRTRCDNHSHYC